MVKALLSFFSVPVFFPFPYSSDSDSSPTPQTFPLPLLLTGHVPRACVRPGPQQRVAELGVARERRPVERRPAGAGLAHAGVGPRRQQGRGDAGLASDDGAGEGGGGGRGAVLDDGLGLEW